MALGSPHNSIFLNPAINLELLCQKLFTMTFSRHCFFFACFYIAPAVGAATRMWALPQTRAECTSVCIHRHAGGEEGVVTMALGSSIPASLYTLPRLWEQLKVDAQYSQRRAAVATFNKHSTWLKRGISITPARYPLQPYRP